MGKTLGQIACEAISGPDGWAGCADVPGLHDMWEAAAQAVAAVERERCAKICENNRGIYETDWEEGFNAACGELAIAIRTLP